jgi:predicted negative regulator of RcsB-dependent stress response
MPSKHMTKKELKEDPFFEEVSHLIGFFQKNGKTLITLGIILVLAVGTFFVTRASIQKNNRIAAGYFGIALDQYMKNNYLAAEDQFYFVANEYKNTDWGKRAHYYLGLTARAMGAPDNEILAHLEAFAGSKIKDAPLKTGAHQLIGSVHYRNGDLLTSGDNYLKAAKYAISNSEKVHYGITAGEIYLEGNARTKRDEVVAYLKTLELNEAQKSRVDILSQK